MLRDLNVDDIEELSSRLNNLSDTDKKNFSPHRFDVQTITNNLKDIGNYYYIMEDEGNMIGYGMLRTFNEYSIPTLGCVIWGEYRSKEYGYKLVQSLISKSISLGYNEIKLKVNKNNKIAYNLYSKSNFYHIGDEGDYLWMSYNNNLKVYIFDIDGTITDWKEEDHKNYYEDNIIPNMDMIKTINILYDRGHPIWFVTGRGAISGIDWKEETENQLKHWGVKYHKLKFIKKPFNYLYVDDMACSPEEFWHKVDLR